MTLALGDVIAQIGGDGGGGGPVPSRYVYDLGDMPIDTGGTLFQVPDMPEWATLVATLEWTGPETGGLAVMMNHGNDGTFGVALNTGSGFPPVTVVSPPTGGEDGALIFTAVDEGYTATRLTAIIIPTINEAA